MKKKLKNSVKLNDLNQESLSKKELKSLKGGLISVCLCWGGNPGKFDSSPKEITVGVFVCI